jgi:two-component system chemotaxis response regulator CheY
MPLETDIKFIKDNAEKHLEQFTEEVRMAKESTSWRCLYARVDPNITKDPNKKNIAKAFLETTFDNAYDVRIFWLVSGHMFLFFQGPVREVIKEYELFLESLNERDDEHEDNTNSKTERFEYHFFWKLGEFWGYFDEVLSKAIQEPADPEPSVKEPQIAHNPVLENPNLPIREEMHRQRLARYKPLLLIVEDDRTTRHLLQATMEKFCDISVAWSAKQAKEFYQTQLPNITFLDIELPDGSGQNLAELFCANDDEAFVVMISGHDTPENRARCMDAGTKGFIAKPASEIQLLKYIDQYNRTKLKSAG